MKTNQSRTRISGAAVDMGAYEFQIPLSPPPPQILLNDGTFSYRSNRFEFNVSGCHRPGRGRAVFDQLVELDSIGHQHAWFRLALFLRYKLHEFPEVFLRALGSPKPVRSYARIESWQADGLRRAVYAAHGTSIDKIIRASDLPSSAVHVARFSRENQRLVKQLPGKLFVRNK